jgi:putative ABC transport system substrate-binding protein
LSPAHACSITIRAARDGAPDLPVVMINAGDPVGAGFVASLARPGGDLTGTSAAGEEVLAKQLELLSDGLRLDRIDVAVEGELEGAIARANGGALVVLGDPMFGRNRVHIIELTLRSQVPSVFGGREYVAIGGLMSCLSSNAWHWRAAASFVDKILKGQKPADIPVEQPTKFELVINLKTAKMLGLTIP